MEETRKAFKWQGEGERGRLPGRPCELLRARLIGIAKLAPDPSVVASNTRLVR